ncbi:hypothetical protein [Frankia casuarinae]|uniref:Uncharacterized protein n=1 Tax=Frankia casuarinae (strain DSM 45818 / CECT 9043 / HFP020203 / CcI3) TaxID=106370 RepID=Q2J5D1_FRACC|nr:hypothetical protein [Frankia casuarinae]ABD13511.1 hypothetical protein Francci3_4163 [Frankia casuarinae]
MSTGGSVQPSLFDDLDDADSGAVVVGGLVAGQMMSTVGSDVPSSVVVATIPADTGKTGRAAVWVGGRAARRPASARGARRGLGVDAGAAGERGTGGDPGPGRQRGRSAGRSAAASSAGEPAVSDVDGEAAADARWIAAQLTRAPEPSALMAAAIVTALAPKPTRNGGG